MRVVKLILLSFVGLLVLLAIWLYLDTVWNSYTSYKRDVKGYMGLDIGASRKEAIYVLGYPDHVLGDRIYDPELDGEWFSLLDTTGEDPVNPMPKNKTINDYSDWSFDKDTYRVDVTFDEKTHKVESIACYVSKERGQCPGIFGIYTGDDEDDIRGELGEADRSKYVGSSKTYQWDGLGIDVTLTERNAYMIEKRAGKGANTRWLIDRVLF